MSTNIRVSVDPDRLAPEADDPSVEAVMRNEVVFCLPSTPIDAVAKLMADNGLAEIVVLLDRRPVGYVAREEIIGKLVAGDLLVAGSDQVRPPVTAVQARHVMRQSPLQVDEKQRLSDVIAVMRQQDRRLAVVMHEDEVPVGMVTAREIAGHLLGVKPNA